ncbi:Uncharacterized protein APZ42_004078, partial [Daphnia magna]
MFALGLVFGYLYSMGNICANYIIRRSYSFEIQKRYKIERQEKGFFQLSAKENTVVDLEGKLVEFIQRGINVNANDKTKCNHILCENHSNENLNATMKCMIQRGIDINAKNERGNNALHILCKLNSSGNLLDATNAGDKNYRNENALHISCTYINLNETLRDAIHVLVTNGINVHDKDGQG